MKVHKIFPDLSYTSIVIKQLGNFSVLLLAFHQILPIPSGKFPQNLLRASIFKTLYKRVSHTRSSHIYPEPSMYIEKKHCMSTFTTITNTNHSLEGKTHKKVKNMLSGTWILILKSWTISEIEFHLSSVYKEKNIAIAKEKWRGQFRLQNIWVNAWRQQNSEHLEGRPRIQFGLVKNM